jgi:hypothetical protein
MHRLKVAITRFVDHHQPGFVECSFVDAKGKVHTVIEKIPVVTDEDLTSHSIDPRDGVIAGTVLSRFEVSHGEPLVRISTEMPDHIETQQGESEFEVSASLVD